MGEKTKTRGKGVGTLTDDGEGRGGGEPRVGDVGVAGGAGEGGLVVPGFGHHR